MYRRIGQTFATRAAAFANCPERLRAEQTTDVMPKPREENSYRKYVVASASENSTPVMWSTKNCTVGDEGPFAIYR